MSQVYPFIPENGMEDEQKSAPTLQHQPISTKLKQSALIQTRLQPTVSVRRVNGNRITAPEPPPHYPPPHLLTSTLSSSSSSSVSTVSTIHSSQTQLPPSSTSTSTAYLARQQLAPDSLCTPINTSVSSMPRSAAGPSKKRSLAEFEGEAISSSSSSVVSLPSSISSSSQTPAHVHLERNQSKRIKATPSQIVADGLAKVDLAASNNSMILSGPPGGLSLSPSLDEIACDETLDDSDSPMDLVSPSPAQADPVIVDEGRLVMGSDGQLIYSTILPPTYLPEPVITHEIPPSHYRSYHSKEPLIVSVESAIDEYDPDLELYMWNSEQVFQPYLYYFQYQYHLESDSRSKLIDWMFEVSDEYNLGRECIYLAVNYLDRFLSASPSILPTDGTSRSTITKQNLQLLGCTCLWVASKVEEIFPPSPDDFAVTTDNAFSGMDIKQMEPIILRALNWRLHAQTPYSFLKFFLKKAARMLFIQFNRRLKELGEMVQTETNDATSIPSAIPLATAPTSTSGSAVPPPLTVHQWHQQFSAMQLEFLSLMAKLLSQSKFIRMMELIDVLTLDIDSVRWYPSHLAASALFIMHPPGTILHDFILAATTYEYAALEPCINFLQLFQVMPAVGMPHESKRQFLQSLLIPYDEFHSRQVYNQLGLTVIQYAQQMRYQQATRNAEQQVAAQNLPPEAIESIRFAELQAHVHTNFFRNIPLFLDENIWSWFLSQGLVKPIKNTGVHQLPGMWMSNTQARLHDPTSYHPFGYAPTDERDIIFQEPELQAEFQSELDKARQFASAKPPTTTSSSTTTPTSSTSAQPHQRQMLMMNAPSIVPHTDSFLQAAAQPYTKVPREGRTHTMDRARLKPTPKLQQTQQQQQQQPTHASTTVAQSAPVPTAVSNPGLIHHSTSSATLASSAAVIASSANVPSTTIYTFGGAPSVNPARRQTLALPPSSPLALSANPVGESLYSLPNSEWTSSSDEEEDEELVKVTSGVSQ